jgi:hypothetical protein
VFENGKPLSAKLAKEIYAWMGKPANIGALWQELRAYDASAYNPDILPMNTAAKQQAITLSASGIDVAYEYMLVDMPGDLVSTHQAVQYFKWADLHRDIDSFPEVSTSKLKHLVEKQLKERATWLTRQIRFGELRLRPRAIRNQEKWEKASYEEIREELMKNGDPTGVIIEMKPPWEIF